MAWIDLIELELSKKEIRSKKLRECEGHVFVSEKAGFRCIKCQCELNQDEFDVFIAGTKFNLIGNKSGTVSKGTFSFTRNGKKDKQKV